MKLIHLMACSFLFAAFSYVESDASESNGNDDEKNIRNARLSFNQAIRDQDVDAIGHFFAPEYHIVTGRSQQSHGVEAERDMWVSIFASDPGFVCQRDTRELRINHGWGLAEELGDWNCYFTADDEPVHASGVYAAKWQRAVGGAWLIQSEVFTTMDCKGNEIGCLRPEAIAGN